MAILNKEEYMELVNKLVPDDGTEESLKIIEDLTDTYGDKSSLAEEIEKLKREKLELDETWKKRYRERFFENKEKDETEIKTIEIEDDEKEEITTYDSIFKGE